MASQSKKGITRNAGRGKTGAPPIPGDGTTTTPQGVLKAPRQERSAGNSAANGNTMTNNPAAHGHKYD
jgi:hypothetical protein